MLRCDENEQQACGRIETAREFWWGYLEERDHVENLGVDARIILK
jgi:hypothetical protein